MPFARENSHRGDAPSVPAPEALLIEQLARATSELRRREAAGGDTRDVRAVIGCLRNTLAEIAEQGSVPEVTDDDYAVMCPARGELEVRHRGGKLPVDARIFLEDLGAAGVDLEPGQVLLADRDWARRKIEESLVGLTLEEVRIREAKGALLRALQGVPAPRAPLY